ncbi:hypothetical protein P8452_24887 [Trifolium repens]|nr:hypothetical protein P8452_24887 [Trifolium repens]
MTLDFEQPRIAVSYLRVKSLCKQEDKSKMSLKDMTIVFSRSLLLFLAGYFGAQNIAIWGFRPKKTLNLQIHFSSHRDERTTNLRRPPPIRSQPHPSSEVQAEEGRDI